MLDLAKARPLALVACIALGVVFPSAARSQGEVRPIRLEAASESVCSEGRMRLRIVVEMEHFRAALPLSLPCGEPTGTHIRASYAEAVDRVCHVRATGCTGETPGDVRVRCYEGSAPPAGARFAVRCAPADP